MAIYKIWSRGITGKDVVYRTEFIDTQKNELFQGARTEADVKRAYEAFWNMDKLGARVKVDRVKRVVMRGRGKNFGIKVLK